MKWCKGHRTLRTRSVFSAVVIAIFRLKSLFATIANGDLSRNIAFTTAENADRVRSVRGPWVRSKSTNVQQCTNVILNRPLERVCLRVLLIISYMTSNICVCWQINLSLVKMFIFPLSISSACIMPWTNDWHFFPFRPHERAARDLRLGCRKAPAPETPSDIRLVL